MNDLGDVNLEDEIIHIVELPGTTVQSTLSTFLGLTSLAGFPLDAADVPILIIKNNSTFKVRHRGFGTRRSVYMVEETRNCRFGGSELHVWIIYERLPRYKSKVGSARIAYLVENLTCRRGKDSSASLEKSSYTAGY
ncbi:uncharacterized protein LOC111038062 [Myzus persicae]|uniref:uncharacterized protein LOC111038062 n=1 Tax=Myzus persicae TaxID=13164 RepID=UPI000B93186D|nr:uncharacterized protein LOC111038062 [Myzus persicae]